MDGEGATAMAGEQVELGGASHEYAHVPDHVLAHQSQSQKYSLKLETFSKDQHIISKMPS